MSDRTLHIKTRRRGNTVQLVRYQYCARRKRSVTTTIGSMPIDADPDDILAYIRLSNRFRNSHNNSSIDPLTDNDLVVLKAWLLQHGDRKAAERRKARDARVEREVLERIQVSADAGDDALTRAVEGLRAAGELLCKLSADFVADGQDPWPILRPRYLNVLSASKDFEQRAKEAGVTKNMGK